MGVGYGRGYLGELGRRLQRLLGFDGEPGADFDSKAIPVMLVGDGTLPGYGDQQGRRFVVSFGVIAAGNMAWMRATSDVIIEKVSVGRYTGGAAATDVEYRVAPIGTADPFALDGTFCFFLDRSVSLGDKPPVLAQAGAAAVAGTFFAGRRAILASDGEALLAAVPFCLGVGQGLCVANPPAGGFFVTVYGRTL